MICSGGLPQPCSETVSEAPAAGSWAAGVPLATVRAAGGSDRERGFDGPPTHRRLSTPTLPHQARYRAGRAGHNLGHMSRRRCRDKPKPSAWHADARSASYRPRSSLPSSHSSSNGLVNLIARGPRRRQGSDPDLTHSYTVLVFTPRRSATSADGEQRLAQRNPPVHEQVVVRLHLRHSHAGAMPTDIDRGLVVAVFHFATAGNWRGRVRTKRVRTELLYCKDVPQALNCGARVLEIVLPRERRRRRRRAEALARPVPVG